MLSYQAQPPTGGAIIQKAQSYLGWAFGAEQRDVPYSSSTLRLIGHQGEKRLVLLRRGSQYRYSSYDKDGRLIRVVVSDGRKTAVSSDGVSFETLPPPTATLLDLEAAMFCNDFHGLIFGAARQLENDRSVQATKAPLPDGTIEVAVRNDGMLGGLAISTPDGVELLRPTAVSSISATLRFYSRWKRNSEPAIVWDRLETHPKIYDGEVTLPG